MLKRYLVAHDDSITEWEPAFVHANSTEEAIKKYLHRIYSKDSFFREYVQELRTFESFLGQLIYATCEEKISFMNGDRTPLPETVREKINSFFSDEPKLGDRFWEYVKSEKKELISDEIYEFIAVRDPDGIVAIEQESIRVLEEFT